MPTRSTLVGRQMRFLTAVFAAAMLFGATSLNSTAETFRPDFSAWCQKQGKEAIKFKVDEDDEIDAKSWRCATSAESETEWGSSSTVESAATVTSTGGRRGVSSVEGGSSTTGSNGQRNRWTNITPISVDDVCADQFGFYFESAIDDWSDPEGWYCESTVTF